MVSARRGRRRFERVFGEMGLWVFFWDSSSSTDEKLWIEDRTVGDRRSDDGVLVSFVWLFTSMAEFYRVFPSLGLSASRDCCWKGEEAEEEESKRLHLQKEEEDQLKKKKELSLGVREWGVLSSSFGKRARFPMARKLSIAAVDRRSNGGKWFNNLSPRRGRLNSGRLDGISDLGFQPSDRSEILMGLTRRCHYQRRTACDWVLMDPAGTRFLSGP